VSTLPKVKSNHRQRSEPVLDRSKPQDRYRGLSVKTILKKVAQGLNRDHEIIAFEYIELNSKAVMTTDTWLTLPRKYVRTILALDGLNAPEVYPTILIVPLVMYILSYYLS
jgi:hypothetical protein